jgi:hypothetical protein
MNAIRDARKQDERRDLPVNLASAPGKQALRRLVRSLGAGLARGFRLTSL